MLDRLRAGFRGKCIQYSVSITCAVPLVVFADSGSKVSLPSANDGFLQKIVTWMQTILDFLGGAGALFFAFVTGFAAIVLWAVAPKQSAVLGMVLRLCVAAIAVFYLALFIAWLQK